MNIRDKNLGVHNQMQQYADIAHEQVLDSAMCQHCSTHEQVLDSAMCQHCSTHCQ